jgi:hypothetical protein
MACQCGAIEHQDTATSAERVRYFPRQLLTADDMRTEQEYFREKLRRHNRYLHGWGVVCGLEVVADMTRGAMYVAVCPGYALSRCGDEIVVEESTPLDLTYCTRPSAAPCAPHGAVVPIARDVKSLLVQIRYVECPSRPLRTLPAGCGCDDTACEYSRIRDGFELQCVVKPSEQPKRPTAKINPRIPACPPLDTDPWIVLAEVKIDGGITIDNEVRGTVRNTPSLSGT